MPSLAELLRQNPALKESLRDSFIPHSKSLTKAWEATPQSQLDWGNHCVNAVLSLDKWLSSRTTPPSIKKVCLAAAGLRSEIHEKMRGEKNYASDRFDKFTTLTTVIEHGSRYADQFSEIIDHFIKLARSPQSDLVLKDSVPFYIKGCPSIRKHGTEIEFPNKESLLVMSLEHRLAQGGKSLRLTQAHYYQWFIESHDTVTYYFALNNAPGLELNAIFQAMDEMKLDVWNQPELDEASFDKKLSTFLWLLYQASPFEAGTASIADMLLKLCLLRRYQQNAPLFIQPGLSLDFRAMLNKLENFQGIFKSLLKKQPAPQEEVVAAYNLPTPEALGPMINHIAHNLVKVREEKTDLECANYEDLFHVFDTKTILRIANQPVRELIANYRERLKQLKEENEQNDTARVSKMKINN
jgi:hypothetical protein